MSGFRLGPYVFSSRFRRIDVETVIHSDNGFAAVSYLRIKRATLEEKQESRNGLTVPPLLGKDFARIQALLLRSHHSTDGAIHGVSGAVVLQPIISPHGSSGSRGSGWVAIGNVFHLGSQDITFEQEVVQCFCDLQGGFTSTEEMLF